MLFGLISHYLKTGKPVGSHTLQEEGFADLSSATIRNYFAHLESEGYLLQQHSSGRRIPSEKAFKLYANACLESAQPEGRNFENLRSIETRELAVFLQHAAEQLSSTTNTPVFLSPPRFEQDFIISIKLVGISYT